jgi:hypothetical protein
MIWPGAPDALHTLTEACCHRDQWPVRSGKLAAGPRTCPDPGRCPAAALRRLQTQARSALDLSAASAPVDRERRRSERMGNTALLRRLGDGRLSAGHRFHLPDQSGACLSARYWLAVRCTSRGKIKVTAASRMRCVHASRLSLVCRCRRSRLFCCANCRPPVPRLKPAGPSCSLGGSPAERSNSSRQ